MEKSLNVDEVSPFIGCTSKLLAYLYGHKKYSAAEDVNDMVYTFIMNEVDCYINQINRIDDDSWFEIVSIIDAILGFYRYLERHTDYDKHFCTIPTKIINRLELYIKKVEIKGVVNSTTSEYDKHDDLSTSECGGVCKAVHEVYGFHINPNNSNPSTAITYLEGAVGKTPVHMDFSTGVFDWGDWDEDEFFMPRPCMLQYDGTVAYYLDPNDYSKKADGTASDISDTSFGGNAMMGWGRDGKKIWYKVVPDTDPTGVSIYFADNQVDNDYHCWNFYGASNNIKDHFYTPIYNGSYISSRIRSLSGQTTGVDQTMDTEISYTRSNNSAGGLSGDRWFIETYGDRMLINWLLVLLGKSLDTQTVYGYANSNNSSSINTGSMNTRGLFWGESTGKYGVKVFGMENWWGNVRRRIVGILTYGGSQYVKLTPGTADGSTGSAYSDTSESGMINTNVTSSNDQVYTRWYKYNSLGYSVVYQNGQNGSNSTYYPDYGYTTDGDSTRRHAGVGGDWNSGLGAGAFYLGVGGGPSNSGSYRGASLSFR